MERLSDERLEALRRFVGERMSPKAKFLEDVLNALTELQERRQQAAQAPLAGLRGLDELDEDVSDG